MKKISIIFTVVLLLGIITGCSKTDTTMNDELFADSEITVDSDYEQYQILMEEGRILESGECDSTEILSNIEKNETDTPSRDGNIQIIFAENNNLSVEYFYDFSLTEKIAENACFLNPGDSIYAKAKSINPNSSLYNVSEYRLYDCTGGNHEIIETISAGGQDCITIPETYEGNKISIMPIGAYRDRNLKCEAYYIDDNGDKQILNAAGTWLINGKKTTKVSPLVSYILSYRFNTDKYFFVSSTPKCYTNDPNTIGYVEFNESDPTEANDEYSVQLHPYIKLSIKLDEAGTVKLNDGTEQAIKKSKEWENDKLKYGDVVTVETKGNCTLTGGDVTHIQKNVDSATEEKTYQFVVTQPISANNDYVVLTLQENGKHGYCTYKLDGEPISGKVYMLSGQKLEATCFITDDNYKFEKAFLGGGLDFIEDVFGNRKATRTIEFQDVPEDGIISPDVCFQIVKK